MAVALEIASLQPCERMHPCARHLELRNFLPASRTVNLPSNIARLLRRQQNVDWCHLDGLPGSFHWRLGPEGRGIFF